jgi:uncharacterized protein (TIGR02302 family)
MSEPRRMQPSGSPSDTPRRHLERLVDRARATLLWERVWPILWRPLAVVMVFLTLSWLGLWLDASPEGRIGGLTLFGIALVLSLWPLLGLRKPGRRAALDRLDRDTGLAHGPARALEDNLALGADDAGSRALWELHRRRAEAAIAKLKLAAPSPGMSRRDRYAVRAAGLVAVAASAFVAGPEIGSRLRLAFDWRQPQVAGPSFRVDGWIDPPLYTRTPPLMIDLAAGAGEQRLRAPIRSTVVIRAAGKGEVSIVPGPGLEPLPAPENPRADLKEQRFTLTGDASLTVRTGIAGGVRLQLDAIPDRAPEIALANPPEVAARGTFTLTYRAKDDYGIVAAEGEVEKAEGQPGRRSLVPAPRLTLTVPSDPTGESETKALIDLTQHPWAGARVKLTLTAKDEAEQTGRSEGVEITLPQRPFTKPLARALVEQRRRLVLDPEDRKRVQTALDALLIAPERFTPQWGVFLGLRSGTERLRRATNDAELLEVAEWLWTMAVQIEDGDLSEAERDLRAAQERLREALERNAPQDEINRLTQELRQAMDRFLREFAERMQRDQQNREAQPNQRPADRTITQDDLNRMLNQIEELARRGDTAEAQRLLDELRNLMENLQTAQPNSRMTDPLARELNRSAEDLDGIVRDQQQLRDETFRQGQGQNQRRADRPQRGQPGDRQPGQRGPRGERQPGQPNQPGEGQDPGEGQEGQQGQQGQQGQGQGQGLGQRQQALRERLEELQRRMRGLGLQGEQGFADAEEAMREAENAIGQGRPGDAVDAQGRALEGLQRGTQGLAQQMQKMLGQGDGTEEAQGEPGPGQNNGRAQSGPRDSDPLGRPTRGREFSDGRVRVPTADESAVVRARRILEELRRKLGDPNRPQEELDYFERLLRRN